MPLEGALGLLVVVGVCETPNVGECDGSFEEVSLFLKFESQEGLVELTTIVGSRVAPEPDCCDGTVAPEPGGCDGTVTGR